jgi:hypothetical protein
MYRMRVAPWIPFLRGTKLTSVEWGAAKRFLFFLMTLKGASL